MGLLRTGIIGLGSMGKNHVRIVATEKTVFELTGVYDKNEETSMAVAKQYGTRSFHTAEELLEQVDAVIIAVPSGLHKEYGILASGYHVHALIEKPLAVSAADARELNDVFHEKKLQLMVGHVERFNPVIIELEKLLENEQIISLETHRYSAFDGRIMDVGVIEDLLIHDIELVCHLMKPHKIIDCFGAGEQIKTNHLDFATGVLRFSSGAHAVCSASRVAQEKERKLWIHLKDGMIEADLLSKTLTLSKNTNMVINGLHENLYTQDSIVQRIFVPIIEPLRYELIAFGQTVNGEISNPIDGTDAAGAIKVCENILHKANAQPENGGTIG